MSWELYQGDCLEIMKNMPDKSVDLVLTDPPYGINIAANGKVGGEDSITKKAKLTEYGVCTWDKTIPSKDYFEEMIRISKNQIIFGGNYFIEYLSNSPCWLVWDKNNEGTVFADCELAWTSFKSAVRKYKYTWNGMIQENMKQKEIRFHPTQKPVGLFAWIIDNYSKPNDIIFDPFAGSGTTGIAAEQCGRKSIMVEKDPNYCEIIKRRMENIEMDLFAHDA